MRNFVGRADNLTFLSKRKKQKGMNKSYPWLHICYTFTIIDAWSTLSDGTPSPKYWTRKCKKHEWVGREGSFIDSGIDKLAVKQRNSNIFWNKQCNYGVILKGCLWPNGDFLDGAEQKKQKKARRIKNMTTNRLTIGQVWS